MNIKEAFEQLERLIKLKDSCDVNRSNFPYQGTEVMEKLSLKIKEHIQSEEFKIESDK